MERFTREREIHNFFQWYFNRQLESDILKEM